MYLVWQQSMMNSIKSLQRLKICSRSDILAVWIYCAKNLLDTIK